ncbi:Phthalate dioxygenase reductase [Aminobacter sp. MSH1]|uniref:PDR/VanB family oxidoreductase n=1 Tax=Aminobacter sp. MSH1 TaxID=374606 RepID=UPI000D351B85|nr:PDR/VanB family oxidoreductase [Aminobacter sp. MSH1]AWC22515.1 Phthalate dioxygenase reductase [Aminobacter sp. MSH1]
MTTPSRLQVVVQGIIDETQDIRSFDLRAADGHRLPAFDAGAHVDVYAPGGYVRQYSLCNDPTETARYVIAVKREPNGRGGSAAMHDSVKAGDRLEISTPRNHFALEPGSARVLLVGGGIGMTPLMAMAETLLARGIDFDLALFARGRAFLPFAERLGRPELAAHMRLHFDAADEPEKIDLAQLLGGTADGRHLYLCGPDGFMKAVRSHAAHWPSDQVHVEHFAANREDVAEGEIRQFAVILAQSGKELVVPADKSILDVLRVHGIDVPTSCEEGVCGTCVTNYSDGEPDHRDFCLSPRERKNKLALCCSRAFSSTLRIEL